MLKREEKQLISSTKFILMHESLLIFFIFGDQEYSNILLHRFQSFSKYIDCLYRFTLSFLCSSNDFSPNSDDFIWKLRGEKSFFPHESRQRKDFPVDWLFLEIGIFPSFMMIDKKNWIFLHETSQFPMNWKFQKSSSNVSNKDWTL